MRSRAVAEIGLATGDEIAAFARRRTHDEASRRLYAELAAAAPAGVLVARDEGTAVGIVIPHALEDEWFLADLYVEPSFRTAGVGWRLLSQALHDAGDVARSGLIEAGELGSAAFFMRRGVMLQTPVLEVAGPLPHPNEIARMAAGTYRFETQPLDPVAHRPALAQLDREIRGSARPFDHRVFAAEGTGTVFLREGEVAGYGYVWPSGRVGPLAAAAPTYLVQFFGFLLAALHATYGASWCAALVPGTNVRIMRACMQAGLSIGQMRILASDAPPSDLTRYVGFHVLNW